VLNGAIDASEHAPARTTPDDITKSGSSGGMTTP
jgi:hypothetical protein